MKARGRPKANALPRDEQLRRAKRAQRTRQRAAGIVHVQLAVPQTLALKLAAARNTAQFLPELNAMLDRMLVCVADYPQLRDLAWNRSDQLIPAREAFALYERNWRFVDSRRLDESERALIDRLKAQFGNGVINDVRLSVPTLRIEHAVAEKLLANADRGLDDSTLSRDLIDLAFTAIHVHKQVLWTGLAIAEQAYGSSVEHMLRRCLDLFRNDRPRAKRCIETLAIDDAPALRKGIRLLQALV